MNKNVIFTAFLMLLLLIKTNSFAQSADIQARSLQGEWSVNRIHMGVEIMNLRSPPLLVIMEMSQIFQGNNLTMHMPLYEEEVIIILFKNNYFMPKEKAKRFQ